MRTSLCALSGAMSSKTVAGRLKEWGHDRSWDGVGPSRPSERSRGSPTPLLLVGSPSRRPGGRGCALRGGGAPWVATCSTSSSAFLAPALAILIADYRLVRNRVHASMRWPPTVGPRASGLAVVARPSAVGALFLRAGTSRLLIDRSWLFGCPVGVGTALLRRPVELDRDRSARMAPTAAHRADWGVAVDVASRTGLRARRRLEQ